ncbi:UNVERIFIED_CONTAM: hypothetical protein FKN15_057016 [Acipenser sinensis]
MFNGEMRSSAVLSAAEVRNVMRSSSISGEMYNMEKSNGSPPDTAGISTNKKRRSSLGAKMVAIVGLSQWSKSTLQLNQAGDVHVGMVDRNGQLEVEVIQARGLTPKPGSKSIPGGPPLLAVCIAFKNDAESAVNLRLID